MLVVEPVADARAQLLPLAAILEHALAAEPIELGDAERLDLLLAADAELLLDLDLDRQAVRVPARLSRDTEALHRAMAAEEILDRAREHVMDARPAVRRRRTFEEHEVGAPSRARRASARRDPPLPAREQLALDVVGRRSAGSS